MKADYFSWCGWCRQSTTASPSLSPALRSLHGRPGCSGSIDLPTSCPSLSLPSPMMRRTHTTMAMLARLARVRHCGLSVLSKFQRTFRSFTSLSASLLRIQYSPLIIIHPIEEKSPRKPIAAHYSRNKPRPNFAIFNSNPFL